MLNFEQKMGHIVSVTLPCSSVFNANFDKYFHVVFPYLCQNPIQNPIKHLTL